MSQRENLRQLTTTALFAAAITVMTAYMLHIPLPTGGYIHLGDALIYLAACLLPVPYAAAAAAIGAGLADLLTAPMWVLPTLVIKAVLVLFFTSKSERIPCRLRPGQLRHGRDHDRLPAPVPGHLGPGHRQRGPIPGDWPRAGRGQAEGARGCVILGVLIYDQF